MDASKGLAGELDFAPILALMEGSTLFGVLSAIDSYNSASLSGHPASA